MKRSVFNLLGYCALAVVFLSENLSAAPLSVKAPENLSKNAKVILEPARPIIKPIIKPNRRYGMTISRQTFRDANGNIIGTPQKIMVTDERVRPVPVRKLLPPNPFQLGGGIPVLGGAGGLLIPAKDEVGGDGGDIPSPRGGGSTVIAPANCNGTIPVKVLAKELNYGNGPNAPSLPVRVWYQKNSETTTWHPLFSGANVVVNGQSDIPVSVNDEIRLKFETAILNFPPAPDNYYSYVYASTDPNNVIIATDGENFQLLAAQKGVDYTHAYGAQQSVAALLQTYVPPMMDLNGLVMSGQNTFLVFVEFNPTLNSPATDFNDLILEVGSCAPVGSLITVRDSITGMIADDTYPASSFRATGGQGTWYITPVTVTATEPVRLTEFRAIGAQVEPDLDLNAFDYVFRAWSSPTGPGTSPNDGDVGIDLTFNAPTWGPTLTGGHRAEIPGFPLFPTWSMGVDISAANIVLGVNESVTLGLQVITPGGLAGIFGWVESSQEGPTDMIFGDSIPATGWPLWPSSASAYNGRVAVQVRGVSP